MKLHTIAMLSAVLVSGTALANSLSTTAPLPTFMSGGVGAASQQEIARVQNQYSLKLLFTGDAGMYLANVAVSIRDKAGLEVVNTVTEGPILLAQLAPGRYQLEASIGMFNKKQTITVGKGLKTHQISFPVTDANREAISEPTRAHPDFGVPHAEPLPSQIPFGYGTPPQPQQPDSLEYHPPATVR
jgi:hypothetical protein